MEATMYYFNRKNWTMNLNKTSDQDIKIPALVMLALAPILGGSLVIFLPFVGIFLMGKELHHKLARKLMTDWHDVKIHRLSE